MSIDYDIPIEAYHAAEHPSKSKLEEFAEFGPQHYHARFVAKTIPGKSSDAFTVGNGFECYLFQGPEEFAKHYAPQPVGMKLSTKAGMAWEAEQGLACRAIISAKDFAPFEDMRKAVMANPIARKLLSQGRPQATVRRELPAFGFTVQARPDWLSLEPCAPYTSGAYLVDLKTTTNLLQFNRDCCDYGYNRQFALGQWLLAREGIQAEAFALVIEKKLAPRCRVLRIPEIALADGWASIKADLERVAECYRTGNWSDEQTEIQDVEVPVWQMRKMEGAA